MPNGTENDSQAIPEKPSPSMAFTIYSPGHVREITDPRPIPPPDLREAIRRALQPPTAAETERPPYIPITQDLSALIGPITNDPVYRGRVLNALGAELNTLVQNIRSGRAEISALEANVGAALTFVNALHHTNLTVTDLRTSEKLAPPRARTEEDIQIIRERSAYERLPAEVQAAFTRPEIENADYSPTGDYQVYTVLGGFLSSLVNAANELPSSASPTS